MSNYTITLSDGVTQFDIYPLEVDGAGVFSTPRAIQSINTSTDEFTLLGDLTYRFIAGFQFSVTGSGGVGSPITNIDGTYTVAPAGSTFAGGVTTIPVVETIGTYYLPLGSISYTITPNTSLALPGRGTVNYGIHAATNLVHVLESFANTTSPSNPLTGQLWFNTTNGTLQCYDGVAYATDTSIIPNKLYVDSKVAKAGDTMTGFLTLSADPTSALHAATKQYVDTEITSVVATANELAELTDVDIVGSPGLLNGDLLRFNSVSAKWEAHQQTYERFTAGLSQTVFATAIPTETNTSGGSARLQVFVNGVYQLEGVGSPPDGDYLVTGPNEITFNTAVPSAANVVIYSL